MKILTFSQNDLFQASIRLSKLILESEYKPEIVIGIKNGGYIVSTNIQKNGLLEAKYISVSCSRPNTRNKNKIKKLINAIPTWFNNYIRIIEHHFLIFNHKFYSGDTRLVKISKSDKKLMMKYRKFLIIDDAIDTGKTMQAVIDNISLINKFSEIRIAVITQTAKNPIVKPSYRLYYQTLVRFPWSCDAKKN